MYSCSYSVLKVITMSSKSTHVSRYRSPRQDYDNHDRERNFFDNDSRSNNRRARHGHSYDGDEPYHGRSRYQRDYGRETERKRSRYESSRRTPGTNHFSFMYYYIVKPLYSLVNYLLDTCN